MPKVRDPNREKAFLIYKKHDGFIDLVEIASQLNLSAGTVRGWKSKDKWDDKLNGTLQKNTERSKKDKNATNQIADEVKQVMDNPELNDKQRLFCLNYIKCFNATKAYQKAYECSYETAMVNGSDLLRNTKVKEQIQSLKQGKLNQAFMEPGDIVQKYMDIAFSDITDYVTFGVKGVTYADKEGREATIDTSYVDINESWMVDGSLKAEISQGKEGIKLKLADRMKALEWLTKYFLINPLDQHRLEYDKRKLEIDLIKIDYEAKKNEPQTTITDSDNFLDALNVKATEVWADEE
jgi:phage terminase small subunit